jgi:SAM-dependent methyltransferase
MEWNRRLGMDFNDYDLVSDLYDIYVPVTYDFDFFLEEAKSCPGEVLELMAGTGRVSIPLLRAGVKLTCVDISEGLNAVFREKLEQLGLQAEVVTADVCELDLGKQFEMAIIPFSSFSHITAPGDQLEALRRIRTHLKPGGRFICTLANPAIRRQAINEQLRLYRTYALPGSGGKLLLWGREQFIDDGQVVQALQFYEEYDAAGVMTRKRLLELHFALISKADFEALAQKAGFAVKALYGDHERAAFDPDASPLMIWVLEAVD